MKGVTILIILSVVGSIVSGIIEKRKASAAKKARSASLGSTSQPTVKTQWKADPVAVKIESLRRRRSAPQQRPLPKPEKPDLTPQIHQTITPITPLHAKDCPLPTSKPASRIRKSPSIQLASLLHNQHNIRTAIVLSEILGKPVSQRN
ncbi:MAG: hypothetical protein ISR75_05575 [Phycisphaerales bacterium]|nr:hypothetical protein [Planctomycetota bacterium]MBL6997889.1 hypothetical protein [Phycisphaerales bacterium]